MDIQVVLEALNVVLLGGTIYAWYNFYKVVVNQCDTCSIGLHESPFKSKCFVGAVFFTIANIISLYALYLVMA